MNVILFFHFTLIISYLIDSNQGFKIAPGYYHGSGVFVHVKGDTVIVDFIFIQKYPRELMTDTLLYNVSNYKWMGRASSLYQKGDKCYIKVNDESSIFYTKKDILIKPDKDYYLKHINEYKNLALLHKCYEDYLNKSVNEGEAKKRFFELRKIYKLNTLLRHPEFLIELDKFKSELERSD
jgi:hypothetical protein